MKHLITLTASLMILLALLSQFVQNQRLLVQLEQGTYVVNTYCSDRNDVELKESLSRIMMCEKEAITIETQGDIMKIKVPLKDILATPKLWGISKDVNQGIYRWERKIEDG